MADLAITAANVVKGAGAVVETGYAGAAITAGQVVYLDPSTSTYKLADSNGVADAKKPRGIALNGASINQPIAVQRGGDINIGATLTSGATYYLSANAGGVCPVADVVTGDDVVVIGVAKSASVLSLALFAPGVTL